MVRICIKDLPNEREMAQTEMQRAFGGRAPLTVLAGKVCSSVLSITGKAEDLFWKALTGAGNALGGNPTSSSGGSSSSGSKKTSPATYESRDGDRIY